MMKNDQQVIKCVCVHCDAKSPADIQKREYYSGYESEGERIKLKRLTKWADVVKSGKFEISKSQKQP